MASSNFLINATMSAKLKAAAERGMPAVEMGRRIGCSDIKRLQTWVDKYGKNAPEWAGGVRADPTVQELIKRVAELEAQAKEKLDGELGEDENLEVEDSTPELDPVEE